jgi:hypothetical protein
MVAAALSAANFASQRRKTRAVARAHCWFDDLVSGRCGSMAEIAKCNGVGKQYVNRLIRLAFFTPEMVERIAAQLRNRFFDA